MNSISIGNLSPGWIPGEPFFEEIYAFQGVSRVGSRQAGRHLLPVVLYLFPKKSQ